MPWEAWTLTILFGLEALVSAGRYGNQPPKEYGTAKYLVSQLAEIAFMAWLVLRLSGAA